MTGERTGLLIIRAWREQDLANPLRAQLRMTTDVSQGFSRSVNLADIDEIVRAVRAWLQEVLDEPTLDE